MIYFKDEEDSVFAYTNEQIEMVAELNKRPAIATKLDNDDSGHIESFALYGIISSVRDKIATMTQISEEEAFTLASAPKADNPQPLPYNLGIYSRDY